MCHLSIRKGGVYFLRIIDRYPLLYANISQNTPLSATTQFRSNTYMMSAILYGLKKYSVPDGRPLY